jgi:putative acetyltransferase
VLKLVRTNSENTDFVYLVRLLNADLAVRDGEEHSFYAKFNKISMIKNVVVAYENSKPVGCGAIKKLNNDSMEVKRMYVLPSNRKLGIASHILKELERWAKELSFSKCILETGKKQPEAIGLYLKIAINIFPIMANMPG